MRCNEATRLMVRHLAQGGAAEPGLELQEHLRLCPACARRMDAYRRLRDEIRSVAPAELPEELSGILAEGIRHALEKPMQLDRPPADPAAEMPGQKKGAIVVAVLISVLTGGLLFAAFSAKEARDIPIGAEVVLSAGEVQLSPPGARNWRRLERREILPAGSQLRTGPDGLVQVREEGVEWWLPGMSRIAFAGPRAAELVAGKAYVECTAGAEVPCTLITGDGTVTCREGAFTALRSMKRLKVGCISGAVMAGEGENSVGLAAGEVTVLREGRPCGPSRRARVGELTHFLRAFESYDGAHMTARQLASLPLAPEEPLLPPSVSVTSLQVHATVRGPIALVQVTISLVNEGPGAWKGALRIGDVLLPQPLVETPPQEWALEPGAGARQQASALCVMRGRSGFFGVGLLPEVWTGGEIGRLQVDVTASAAGGLRRFACPTLGARLSKREAVIWSWRGEPVAGHLPILIEVEPAEAEGVDCLVLEPGREALAVVAWRPRAREDEWIRKGRNIFVAFDAAADFGAGGASAAQDVMDALLSALPPASSTALLAYDGALKLEPGRLTVHLPERVEAMLGALWALREDGEPRTADFLCEAILCASAAEGEALVIFVTGRDMPERLPGCEEALGDPRVRLAVVQVGAQAPAPAYRALCAASGGVALALPSHGAAELGIVDCLVNLRQPAIASAEVQAAGQGRGVILQGQADFANQPVVALVTWPKGTAECRGRLFAQAGQERLARDYACAGETGPVIAGEAAEHLAKALRQVAWPEAGP